MVSIVQRAFRCRSIPLLLCLAAVACACSASKLDLADWRARGAVARRADARGELAAEIETLQRLRAADQLVEARQLALALAAEHPDDARVQLLASRAESDGVFLFPESDKESRNHAAASSLHYAQRAAELGESSPEGEAQLAWALGTTTHLQSMGDRAAHARNTQHVAETVLESAPDEPTALATLAVLNLRLQTLPWIANLMASDVPESSLESAERFARRAVAARASRENRLILAKVLFESEREAEAVELLERALTEAPAHPRDRALEAPIRAWLEEHR